MKTVLTTLNAKYIHTSLALRWLYVANKDRFNISFKEFVIKEDLNQIATALLVPDPDIIGIGIYIWNIDRCLALASLLKARKPELILIAGGPEVSYDPEFFLNDGAIDFIISGEGEFVLGELLSALDSNPSGKSSANHAGKPFIDHANIRIESVSHQQSVSKKIAQADLVKLSALPSPYRLDIDRDDLKNKLVYFETSRGCPFQCQYCLSSLEHNVRYFPLDYIFQNLKYLIESGARQIKFLDRTFNLNQNYTLSIFHFLLAHYRPCLSFQFEIVAELLTNDLIQSINESLPPHYFRFEIGIQSTYEPTNRAVSRKQDFGLLAAQIRKLTEACKVDLHLDLIAGLPHETFERFRQSFNDIFAFRAKEVQLGFLKMLRGTTLRQNAALHGYQYSLQAPYEIISNNWLTAGEIKRLHDTEHALETYWNSGKFNRTLSTLFDTTCQNRYFELFDEIGQYIETHKISHHAVLLEDTFLQLHRFLLSKNINLFQELRKDYYACFKIRPHGFWENRIEKKLVKQLRFQIGNDKEFLNHHRLNRKIIEKQTAIDLFDDNHLLLTVFCTDGSRENPLFLHYPINRIFTSLQGILTMKIQRDSLNPVTKVWFFPP